MSFSIEPSRPRLGSSRPIRATISLSALQHNYLKAKAAAPEARAWAVIKADAYGHGQWRAYEALKDVADGFALLETENAVALREAGAHQPILLLEGIFSARDARAVHAYQLSTVVHCHEQLDLLLAHTPPETAGAVFVKLNTGMNRLGFTAETLPSALDKLKTRPGLQLTLMTHFAEADAVLSESSLPGSSPIDAQLACFEQLAQGWSGPACLANSAALIRFPQTHRDWVRPGIMLYGASPFADQTAESLGLQPVMTLESAVIGIQSLKAGDRVGYGGTFVADRPMRIGVVACGYADGYPRHAGTGTPIMVQGQRTRILGRVSMDMLAVDLSDHPDAGIGAPVTLWGEGLAGSLPADEVASAAGTIAYELFCALAGRVPVTVNRAATTKNGSN